MLSINFVVLLTNSVEYMPTTFYLINLFLLILSECNKEGREVTHDRKCVLCSISLLLLPHT